MIDTQSVKTTGGGGERGYDGAKNIKGRKRHLLVDTQGLVRACTVPAADVLDRAGVPLVLSPEETPAQGPRLAHIGLDAGSKGTGKGKDWMEKACDWLTDTVRPPSRCVLVFEEGEPAPRPAFTVLPRRWAVERPFAWLGQSRRLSKDYERLCETSEAMISATMRRRMIRRLPAA
jgi:transposase